MLCLLASQLIAMGAIAQGGGTVGLMGAIAKTVVQGLGDEGVIGVIPEALAPREVRTGVGSGGGGRGEP